MMRPSCHERKLGKLLWRPYFLTMAIMGQLRNQVCALVSQLGAVPPQERVELALLRPTLASHRNLDLPHMLGFQIPVPLSLCSLTGSMIPGRPLGLYHLQRRGSGTPASILTRIRTLNQPLQCYRRLNGPLQTAKQQRIAVPSRRWSHPSPCAWGSSNSTRFPKLTTLCRSGARIEFEQVGLVEKGEAKNFHLN